MAPYCLFVAYSLAAMVVNTNKLTLCVDALTLHRVLSWKENTSKNISSVFSTDKHNADGKKIFRVS